MALVRAVNREYAILRFYRKFLNFEYVKYLIFDPAALPIITIFILLFELMLNVFVIEKVPYTEIDWKAYMQECEGFLNGTTNYALLKGDTGPLVYPAGFVYIYSILYYVTSRGQNIHLAQYIFGVIYLLQLWLVLRLYSKSRKVPPYVLIISAFTSYRIHSIYVLRLFNDPIAILFLYASLNLFVDRYWFWGSIFYSLGVSTKMNILLFSPALFFFYLTNVGWLKTIQQLFVCAVVQLILGAPFLFTYPIEYLKSSFDMGRVFDHKWTVNYRFLPKPIFENKYFHLTLLVMHLLMLFMFVKPTMTYFQNYARLRELEKQFQPQLDKQNTKIRQTKPKKSKKSRSSKQQLESKDELTRDQQAFIKSFEKSLQRTSGLKEHKKIDSEERLGQQNLAIHFDQCTQLALTPFFITNFIGVVFARSLHYQFYVWYFHSLPYLAWSTPYSLGTRYLLLGLIEFCWNTYPSTYFSSVILHLCHFVLLAGLGYNVYKTLYQSNTSQRQQDEKTNESFDDNQLNQLNSSISLEKTKKKNN
ncbi:lethal(2)neighbour of tid protein 2 [Glossina fuscipes]|uniref:dolichyl-P-Man:Man5GlcNAc2-PP-dolichol alpha-1,3-mannosyltransferase n=1 Tax=Glossina fuscipes TaxID=7396 RepID=A0A8U0WM53_9MUSC|nr:lethal(2)neighbour of tid protein 2 [Glossina fuscipes]